MHLGDFTAHAEIIQHAFQHACVLFEGLIGKITTAASMFGLGQQRQGRQVEFIAGGEEGRLRVGARTFTGLDRLGGAGDARACTAIILIGILIFLNRARHQG